MDRRWHLAQSAAEVDTTELEFALMRAFEGFGRWQTECLASVCDLAATGPENAMLHIIRMNDRPKSLKEIARLMNRDDVPNIQYSLRKLMKAGLIEKASDRSARGTTYQTTAEGRERVNAFVARRRELVLGPPEEMEQLREQLRGATKVMSHFIGLYDQAARVMTTRS